MPMEAIVAVYSDWGIGIDGTQPVVVKADRQHFIEMTRGAAVIVGRKTLEDFPGGRPLKGRNNIVITRQNIQIEEAEVAHTTEEALKLAEKYPRTLVLGGASVFRQFMPWLDLVHVTKIDACPPSDSFFENLDTSPEWEPCSEENWLDEDGLGYCFVSYRRIK